MEEENRAKAPNIVEEIARQVGGTITEVGGPLPDGSGFAIMSMPLPKTHWIYQGDRQESYGVFNTPPIVFRMGSRDVASLLIQRKDGPPPFGMDRPIHMTKEEFADKVKAAGRYAVRCATMNGKEMDFDPDALIQNLLVGMLGYWTDNGLSSDEWANPRT
jgi:hypothetical protein